jgi:hypothetical protein
MDVCVYPRRSIARVGKAMNAIVDVADPNSVTVAAGDYDGLVLHITDGVGIDGADFIFHVGGV